MCLVASLTLTPFSLTVALLGSELQNYGVMLVLVDYSVFLIYFFFGGGRGDRILKHIGHLYYLICHGLPK